MTYDDDMLQEINASVNLVEYASRTMELEKKGKDYFTRCPLHIDKTPSLSFNEEANSYYCFSCGKAGGMIGFLMDYEGMEFKDAVEKAARLADIDISKMCHSDTITFLKKVKKLFQKKQTVEHRVLNETELDKYDKEIAEEWISEGIRQDVMDLFGVRVDKKNNRIVYPVRDEKGQLINIKARTRIKEYKLLHIPKYINYYTIGVMDYFQSLDITKPYILEKGEVIIFESVKSVMKAYGWGYKNCVSAEKHTLTDEQLNILAKLKVDVVFAYDSDISYYSDEVWRNIKKLKNITNVYVIDDKEKLLGGKDAKNAPVDLTKEIWEELYSNKRKIT